jgi:hypothetical protein
MDEVRIVALLLQSAQGTSGLLGSTSSVYDMHQTFVTWSSHMTCNTAEATGARMIHTKGCAAHHGPAQLSC